MVFELEKLLSDATIIAMHAYDDEIILFDKKYTLYHFGEEHKITSKTLLIPNQEILHSYNKAVSFSPVSKHLLMLYGEKPLGLQLDVSAKAKILNKITVPRKNLEVTRYSPKGSYFAIGDASGRTNIFQTDSANLVTSLLPRPDYISCLEFSSNERFLVSAAYDKSVIIFDLVLNVEIATLRSSDIVESVCFYKEDNAVAFLQRNGAMQVYHIDEGVLDGEKNIFVSWPTCSALTKDKRHLLVGMKNGSVCAVNLETRSLVFDEKICNSGVTQMSIKDNILMVAQETAYVRLIDIEYLLEDFVNALKIKEHGLLKDMIDKNIFLILDEFYDQEMIELYEPLFKKINMLMQKGEIETAKALVKPYENDQKIMDSFNLLLNSEPHIRKLAELVKSKQIVDAYNLIAKYHILRETPAAIELERYWQASFNKAKLLCKSNDVIRFKEAERVLKPFERVLEKKTEIHAVLKNTKLYVQADDFISKKKFKEYFELVAKAPFLANNEVHKNIVKMSQTVLQQLKQCLLNNDFAKAKEFLIFLAPFTNLAEEYKKVKEALITRVSFFDALNKDDLNSVFTMVKENPELRLLKEYETIEEKFKLLSKKALDVAFKADVSGVLKLFEPYKGVALFEDKIASLVKIAYLNEMRKAAKESSIDWEGIFTRFVVYFGKSDDLIHVARQINQIEVLKLIKIENDRYGYKKHKFTNTILS